MRLFLFLFFMPKCKHKMNQEGFEPPTFGSGIRRAAVAPLVRHQRGRAGIEPATSRTRSENHTSRPTARILSTFFAFPFPRRTARDSHEGPRRDPGEGRKLFDSAKKKKEKKNFKKKKPTHPQKG